MAAIDPQLQEALTAGFTWHDQSRTIRFGPGALADAPALLGDGYTLLTTARARFQAPALSGHAAAVHELPMGYVEDLAASLLNQEHGSLIVALGGGTIVDTAKALAGATGARAAAVPTTLSAAEMTAGGRIARGAPPGTGTRRPSVVINDPALSASQPAAARAASAGNSLGHAIDGACSILASPIPVFEAQQAAALLSHGLPESGDADPSALALGALLSGHTIDSTRYGLHHILSQTMVRAGRIGHGPANVILLPYTTAALRRRAPHVLDGIDAALGEPAEDVARRFARLSGAQRLRDLHVDEGVLAMAADAASQRPDLDLTPPRADRAELLSIYEAAW